MTRRMLVAGIGNVFLGDDAFGVEVAQRLAETQVPAGVEVLDVGIRGVHLAYQLMDGYEELLLVDAVSRGDRPGTVTVIEPAVDDDAAEPLDPHRLEPGALLASLRTLGALPPRVLVIGCEPADLGDGMGLSPTVGHAVAPAINVVRRLIDDFVARGREGHEEEAAPARGAGPDRLLRLSPTVRHRAVPADEADVSVAPSVRGRC
jgi:hydrogenase maturation protease